MGKRARFTKEKATFIGRSETKTIERRLFEGDMIGLL